MIVTVNPNQAPVADAGPDKAAPVNEAVAFDGSGSSDPDGTIVSYQWNFGDGGNAAGITTSHAYSSPGTYVVTLTVTDNTGETDSDQATVTATVTEVEGHILSKNPDYSTDDRFYAQADTMYIRVFTSIPDYNNLKKAEVEFRNTREKISLTNHHNGIYTASKSLSNMPLGGFQVKIKIEDNKKKKYQAQENVTLVSAPVHDVAVTAITMPALIEQGQAVSIEVAIANEGSYPETFTLKLKDLIGNLLIGSREISLAANESKTETFTWDTTGTSLGEHTLEATASTVSGETNIADNLILKSITVVEELPAMEVSLNAHQVNSRWDSKKALSKSEVKINFTVDSGSSSQVVVKEITDDSGTWSLEKPQVEVKINGQRNKWNISLDANQDVVIDFGAKEITLKENDTVEIKLKLLNDQQSSHSFTVQITADGTVVATDTVNFASRNKKTKS